MVIVDSEKELNHVCNLLQTKTVMVVPIYSNNYVHTRLQSISLFWVHGIEDKSDYVVLLNHSEVLFKVDSAIIRNIFYNSNYKYFIDYKDLLFRFNIVNGFDIELLQYLDNGNKLTLPTFKCLEQFRNVYPRYPKLNELIPVAKWIEYFELIKPTLLNLIHTHNPLDRAYKYYNTTIIPSVSKIESNGLKVSVDKISKNIMKSVNVDQINELIYSQYNITTTTGRPSNRYNTINFAALNKDNGVREMFISRFDPGALIEFDFDSYHLRIIGNLINYKLPKESMHEYLGRYYFNKDELTEAEYEESKQISFRQLYGGVLPEYKHIKFFSETEKIIEHYWHNWKTLGYIESPVSGRRLYRKNYPALNAQKLFNYLIQLLETEINMDKISTINEFLSKYNTKLILYTYDSVLFDFDFKDGKKCIRGIEKILKENNFTIRKYIGSNYHDLKEIIE
jgi:hypothetical protein